MGDELFWGKHFVKYYSITIHSDDSLEMFVGDVSPIDAELDPEEAGNLTYNSSNTNVATVDSYGKVRAVGEGEAVITVRFAGNYEYRSSKATVTVKVSNMILKLNFSAMIH